MDHLQFFTSEEEEAIASKFMPIELFSQSPRIKFDELCVFWRKEEATDSVSAIQNHIKTALCSFHFGQAYPMGNVLFQFWAATTTRVGDRLLLTTSQQPFAFKFIEENIIRYWKNCVDYTFGDGDGIIGRVFRTQLPEYSPTVSNYSLKDYRLRDLAVSCGITSILALPIFEPSQHCVGVLELLYTKYQLYDGRILGALKLAGLVTIDPEMIRNKIKEDHVAETNEIKDALDKVGKELCLSLACVWVRCKVSTSSNHDGNSSNNCTGHGRDDFVISLPQLLTSASASAAHHIEAYVSLQYSIIRVGQGLVGKAFLSDKPYLCTDLTQLGMNDHPMALFKRRSELNGCITICLQSTATHNRDYVLEFYLPDHMTYGIKFHRFFSSMVITLKHQLKHFKPVVVNSGDKLFEVEIYSINRDFELLEFPPPTIITENEAGAFQNKGEVLQANFEMNEFAGEVLQANFDMDEFANSVDDSSKDLQQRGKAFVLENNCQEKISVSVLEEKRLEKKSKAQNQKEVSCSYATLKQHFGRKLEDAAESLGVSRSTVKRWCRENNINRWPFPKRSKVTSLLPIPKPINESIQSNIGRISDFTREDPSSSDAPIVLAPLPATSTIMVKAKYKNDFIKFQLSFSSRMIDLVEKVTRGLKLSEGMFTIKYLDVDGDYILITCDEDIQVCINSVTEGTEIKMLIEHVSV